MSSTVAALLQHLVEQRLQAQARRCGCVRDRRDNRSARRARHPRSRCRRSRRWPRPAPRIPGADARAAHCAARRAHRCPVSDRVHFGRSALIFPSRRGNSIGLVSKSSQPACMRLLAVAFHRMRGQRDHRNRLGRVIGLESARRLPAVHHRQAHVHQDEIGLLARRHVDAFLAVHRDHDLEAVAQQAGATACPGSFRCLRPAEFSAFAELSSWIHYATAELIIAPPRFWPADARSRPAPCRARTAAARPWSAPAGCAR